MYYKVFNEYLKFKFVKNLLVVSSIYKVVILWYIVLLWYKNVYFVN